jgi:hypothetical protein
MIMSSLDIKSYRQFGQSTEVTKSSNIINVFSISFLYKIFPVIEVWSPENDAVYLQYSYQISEYTKTS